MIEIRIGENGKREVIDCVAELIEKLIERKILAEEKPQLRKSSGKMIINVRKFTENGIPKVEVINFKGFKKKEELPNKYKEGYPYACFSDKKKRNAIKSCVYLIWKDDVEEVDIDYLFYGKVFNENRWNKIIEVLKACGERLAKINAELRKKEKETQKEGEIVRYEI